MTQKPLDGGGSGYLCNLRCEKNIQLILTGPMDSQIRIDKISKDQTMQLRHSVLWRDLPLSHVCLPEDDAGLHYGAFSPQRDTPIAVISLFRENIPTDEETLDLEPGLGSAKLMTHYCEAVRFRKFACEPQYQGQGYGSQLLLHALSMVRSEWGVTMAWCDARTATQEWYKRRGFQPFGPKFFKGTVEYVRMKADLKDLKREEHLMTTCSVSPVFLLDALRGSTDFLDPQGVSRRCGSNWRRSKCSNLLEEIGDTY